MLLLPRITSDQPQHSMQLMGANVVPVPSEHRPKKYHFYLVLQLQTTILKDSSVKVFCVHFVDLSPSG
jgi:hypothetical protein